uniref:RWP-RK domain-containing protein n=1 Tax=Vannella robusta TaxID=1487602 RepID=A0A7S4HUE9_9EUKA|mmetsp:Transcript_15883/g.20221  ORF Transcript_15883/g.20221 Transcript_15883/m.20221 type:complete len:262 (+) Transcript_15883:30-815(+)
METYPLFNQDLGNRDSWQSQDQAQMSSFQSPSKPFDFERRPTMGLQRTPTFTSNFPIQHTPVPMHNSYPSSGFYPNSQTQQQPRPMRPNTSYIVNGPCWENSPPPYHQQQQQQQQNSFYPQFSQPCEVEQLPVQNSLCEVSKNEFVSFDGPKITDNDLAITVSPAPSQEQNYCDITEYLNMPQTKAAKLLGIPTSTLSKRWKEAAPQRKWPWRTTCKIDKQVSYLLQDIPPGGEIPLEDRDKLALLIRKRQEELRPIVIRF